MSAVLYMFIKGYLIFIFFFLPGNTEEILTSFVIIAVW